MKHRVHKFQVRLGKDANDMLMRKLITNFLEHGTMITTEKKGKALSSYIARIIEKSKDRTEANKNYLLRQLSSQKVIENLFEKVGPVFKDVSGGYLTLQRLSQRVSDGAMMVKLAWSKPVVQETKVVTKPAKKDGKSEESLELAEKRATDTRGQAVSKTK